MSRSDYTDRKAVREMVFKRDNYTCRYCGSKQGPFHADHVYPYSKGGETSINNLVTACERCNTKKSNKVGLWPFPIGHFEPKPKKANVYLMWGIPDLVIAFIALLNGDAFFGWMALAIGLLVLGIGAYEYFFTNGIDWIEEENETE